MKLSDLIIDPRSLGSKLWLVNVYPAYEYQNNKRTNNVLGYRYSVSMPEHSLDKVDVLVEGEKRMEAPNGYVEVQFDGLEVYLYWSDKMKQYQVGARAKDIRLVVGKT